MKIQTLPNLGSKTIRDIEISVGMITLFNPGRLNERNHLNESLKELDSNPSLLSFSSDDIKHFFGRKEFTELFMDKELAEVKFIALIPTDEAIGCETEIVFARKRIFSNKLKKGIFRFNDLEEEDKFYIYLQK